MFRYQRKARRILPKALMLVSDAKLTTVGAPLRWLLPHHIDLVVLRGLSILVFQNQNLFFTVPLGRALNVINSPVTVPCSYE